MIRIITIDSVAPTQVMLGRDRETPLQEINGKIGESVVIPEPRRRAPVDNADLFHDNADAEDNLVQRAILPCLVERLSCPGLTWKMAVTDAVADGMHSLTREIDGLGSLRRNQQ